MSLFRGRWPGAAVLLSALLIAARSGAQDAAALKAMPKSQQEVIEQIAKFKERYEGARRLKNRLAKKDAMDAIKSDQTTWLADVNKKLEVEGAEDWIGQASVGGSGLVIENLGPKSNRAVSIRVSAEGLSDEAREAVKALGKREWVKFTVAPNALRLVGQGGGGGVWTGLVSQRPVDGKMLTKISKHPLE